MKHGRSNRLRQLIWRFLLRLQDAYFPERNIFASYLIHPAYANERLNLTRSRVVCWIGEGTILFTLMGNVFSAVSRLRSLFIRARTKNKDVIEHYDWKRSTDTT